MSVPVSVPALPMAQLRAALEAGQWDAAGALLDEHQRALVAAFASTGHAVAAPAAWDELLAQQHTLLEELRGARDEVARALAQLGSGSRGARAYLQQAHP